MKLISMTDFVIENENMVKQTESEMSKNLFKLAQYAHFLKQPIQLWMFIPCNENNETITERHYSYFDNENEHEDYCNEMEEAKQRCLFEGFEFRKGKATHLIEFWQDEKFLFTYNVSTQSFLIVGSKIENLVKYNLKLTK